MWLRPLVTASVSFVYLKATSSLCLSRQRERLLLPLFTSQVNRCNSLLVGAPKCLLDCLQSVLNAAARLLCNHRKHDHVTLLFRDVLHWLPVPLCIEYKICLLVYKSLNGEAPGYLCDYCIETYSSASELRLRST